MLSIQDVGKKNTNVAVPTDTFKRLAEYVERRGLVQRRVMDQLINWFLRMEPPAQRAVLDDIEVGLRIAYLEAIRQIEADLAEEVSADQDASSQTQESEQPTKKPDGRLTRQRAAKPPAASTAKPKPG